MNLIKDLLGVGVGKELNVRIIEFDYCPSIKADYCKDIVKAIESTCVYEENFASNFTLSEAQRHLYDFCDVIEKTVIRKMKVKGIKTKHKIFSVLSKKVSPKMVWTDMGELCHIEKVLKEGRNWVIDEICPLIENRRSTNPIESKMMIGLMFICSGLRIGKNSIRV